MVDISGRTVTELLFSCVLIIIAAIINAVIFGQFASMTTEIKKDSNDYIDKLSMVNAAMNQVKVPTALR